MARPATNSRHSHAAPLAHRRGLARRGIEPLGAVAEFVDRPQDRAQAYARFVPLHLHTARGEIDDDAEHAVAALEPALDQPGAGAAGNAFDQEGRLPDAAIRLPHERFLHIGNIVDGKLARHGGSGHLPLRQRAAIEVVRGKAVVGDGLRHGRAAGTAHRPHRAVDHGMEPAPGGHRLAAMETGARRFARGAS